MDAEDSEKIKGTQENSKNGEERTWSSCYGASDSATNRNNRKSWLVGGGGYEVMRVTVF